MDSVFVVDMFKRWEATNRVVVVVMAQGVYYRVRLRKEDSAYNEDMATIMIVRTDLSGDKADKCLQAARRVFNNICDNWLLTSSSVEGFGKCLKDIVVDASGEMAVAIIDLTGGIAVLGDVGDMPLPELRAADCAPWSYWRSKETRQFERMKQQC
jgi:hypothetical protein